MQLHDRFGADDGERCGREPTVRTPACAADRVVMLHVDADFDLSSHQLALFEGMVRFDVPVMVQGRAVTDAFPRFNGGKVVERDGTFDFESYFDD